MNKIISTGTKVASYVKNTGKGILKETSDVGKHYSKNIQNRWAAGARVAKKHNMNKAQTIGTQVKSVATGLRMQQEHLPAFLGFLSFVCPIPTGGPFSGYAVGKAINGVVNTIKKIK